MGNIKLDTAQISRRHFLGGAAGLTFVISIGPKGTWLVADAAAKAPEYAIGAWVRITPDNQLTIITPAAEMGQGSMTGVPIALAEELDADWSTVTLEMAPADPATFGYNRRGGKVMRITGSRAIRSYFEQMRLAGAQVRKVLLQAAAEEWGVDASTLVTEPNTVVDRLNKRKLSYGEIASFATVPAAMPTVSTDELKKVSEFRLIGNPVPRADIPAKVDGSAKFSIDVQLPGMVYASTVHAPVQLAEPESWNDSEVRRIPGVIDVVRLDKGVAIVADTFEHVLAARRVLAVDWKKGAPAEGYDSEKALEQDYMAMAMDRQSPRRSVAETGDVTNAFASAVKVYKADFRSDYCYHAQMEPLNAVARFNAAGDKVEIWEGTQSPGGSRAAIADALEFEFEQVIHHQMYMGGAFGRRSITDYTIETALIARATKRPVKMIWTREEDLAFAMFRPQNLQCLEAALDDDGKIAGWRHCVIGDGDRLITSGINIEDYYTIPNRLIEQLGASHGIRLKHWRAVAHPFNIFAIESLVDEIAADQGLDPLEFRRKRLAMTPKAEAVFDAVEKLSNWHTPRPDGRALGLSVTERSGSLGAGVVEISLDRERGRIRVHKVWAAIDGGIIVQPDMARANVESGIVYGLSSVLKERATIKNGAVVQSNFHDYQVLKMSEAPEEIHVEFLDRETSPTGLGEIGNPFIGAAVANAFHALTGKRLYHMPFTPERVRAALQT
ncbi:MAG: xanthine dehydrogenase family protein molybdopterin-binding subunit [Proteobacteria bacterium]|nr:xanthine dehydrogenase family protein molybdopterin-binding subunit [Pseudomonadota bacterium]